MTFRLCMGKMALMETREPFEADRIVILGTPKEERASFLKRLTLARAK